MSKHEKLIKRFKSQPKDFTYEEMKTLLNRLGYEEENKGKTSGSRVIFYNEQLQHSILFAQTTSRKYH
jgi:mRNA-degrading endonuclease RelE of RelBE toxin-antitoxin system